MTQEALKLALEALENGDVPTSENAGKNLDAITAIKEALAQTQEPVATDWERIARVQNAKLMAMCNEAGGFEKLCEVMDKYEKTTPPQRTWVGLTDEEVRDLWSWSATSEAEKTANTQQHAFARAIEARLKELNT